MQPSSLTTDSKSFTTPDCISGMGSYLNLSKTIIGCDNVRLLFKTYLYWLLLTCQAYIW